eukprot:1640281-Amphidinium_carterae.1
MGGLPPPTAATASAARGSDAASATRGTDADPAQAGAAQETGGAAGQKTYWRKVSKMCKVLNSDRRREREADLARSTY